MKKLAFLAMLLVLSPLAKADIILGEYAGPGTYSVTYADSVNTHTYNGNCKVALNIDKTNSRFAIEFSVFECGFDYFNDPVFIFAVRDGKLFSGQTEVGKINTDGSVDFTAKSTVTQTSTEITRNSDCSVRSINKKTYNLSRKISYHVALVGENTYKVTREAATEELLMQPHKDWPQCRVEMKAEISRKSVKIESTVAK